MGLHYRTLNKPRVRETACPEFGMPEVNEQESRDVQNGCSEFFFFFKGWNYQKLLVEKDKVQEELPSKGCLWTLWGLATC